MIYLNIDESWIDYEKTYSFPIFMFDENAGHRFVALYSDHLAGEETIQDLRDFSDKGALFQINREDLELLKSELDISKKQVEDLNLVYFKMSKLQKEREEEFSKVLEKGFIFKDVLKSCYYTKKYDQLRERCIAEVAQFSLSHSEEQSSLIEFVLKCLKIKDSLTEEAAFAYFLAKFSNIKDPFALLSLLSASLLKDLGISQVPFRPKILDLKSSELFEKHPILTYFVLSKTPYEAPKLVKRIILEHHELQSGEGFPSHKTKDHIHKLSSVCGISYMIFSHIKGLWGKEFDLIKVITLIYQQASHPTLKTAYDPEICSSVGALNFMEK